jgi:hypothetical protein
VQHTLPLITPGQNILLRIIEKSEQCLLLCNTLWIEGVFSNPQRIEAERQITNTIKGMLFAAREFRLRLQRVIQENQKKGIIFVSKTKAEERRAKAAARKAAAKAAQKADATKQAESPSQDVGAEDVGAEDVEAEDVEAESTEAATA